MGLWDVVDESVLVVIEPARNAVDHARSTSRVTLGLDGRAPDHRGARLVRVSHRARTPPRPAGAYGRGLVIVTAVSSASGLRSMRCKDDGGSADATRPSELIVTRSDPWYQA